MKSLTQSLGLVFNTMMSLVFIVPVYIILSTILSQGMLYLNRLSKTRSSYIYRYLGDISWALPFDNPNEFRLTQVLLVAITLGLLSILILGFMIFSTYGESKYQQTKARLIEEIKKEQDKINQEQEQANQENQESEAAKAARKEQKQKDDEYKRREQEKQKQTSDMISAEMKRRKREQELEEMKKRQEEMYEDDKKIKEEKKKNNIVDEVDDD